MSSNPCSSAPSRRHLRRLAAIGATAMIGAVPAVLAGSASAGAATTLPPPPVTVLADHTSAGHGDIFLTPTGDQTTYGNGPEIINDKGKVVWFHDIPVGQTASDFRTQTYDGQTVLTWWQGTGLGGLSDGTDYIYNTRYKQIATVNAGNGFTTDGHEFLITPDNTALITSYDTSTVNLAAIGGPTDQVVINAVVQEIDIATGAVLFQWQSDGSVPYGDSEQPLPSSSSTPWDWFHVNAIHLDTDGNFLINARDTWTTYKVNRSTGAIMWELGGKQSSFTEKSTNGQFLDSAGEIFSWEHDPEAVGHNTYTWFDNESAGSPELPYSRVVTVKLDLTDHVATLVSSIDQPEGLSAASQGNAQTEADGDVLVGWGILPYISEFSSEGALLYNAELPSGVNTYRAFRLAWPPAAS